MENLVKQLSTMETISKLRAGITDNIMTYIDEHDLLGEYRIKTPFEVADGNVAIAFEVEWCDHLDHSEGKTIYFYLTDINGDQVDGEFIWDINIIPLDFFYNNVLSQGSYEEWV